jgi:hypothetical protein
MPNLAFRRSALGHSAFSRSVFRHSTLNSNPAYVCRYIKIYCLFFKAVFYVGALSYDEGSEIIK